MKSIFQWYIAVILTAFFAISASGKDYKGAEFRTKLAYTYGRFEVRMKSCEQEGMLSSFFTYHDYSSGGSENWNEIDIEIIGRYSDDVQFNVISPGQTNHVRHEAVQFNPADDFHTYAFEWTPTYVAWFIDGVEVARQTGSHIAQLNKAQKIMMNVWNQNYPDWTGTFNPQLLPAFAYYDWVQYSSYTPGTGNSGTGNNFTFQWKDEFDSWDQSRWDKATHTFDGNLCDFTPANAVFADGKLVLCLTNNTYTGMQDKNPPVPLWARHDGVRVTVRFGEPVEKNSAEDLANYLVYGKTVLSAQLQTDRKTVILTTSGLTGSPSYLLNVKGVKDLATPANVTISKNMTIYNPPEWTFPIKINVGGPVRHGYMAEQAWIPAVNHGYLDGKIATYGFIQIANTSDDSVFFTERNGLARYYVRVPNGVYTVKLLFAENYFSASYKRIFDVFVNGKKSVANMDIYRTAGQNAALIKEVQNVEVTDGLIRLGFAAQIENPLINGIVIEKVTTGLLDDEGYQHKKSFALEQNYPNPFNPETKISYHLYKAAKVKLTVFSTLGEPVAEPVNQYQAAGEYNVHFSHRLNSGKKLSSGCYFYQLTVDAASVVKKMILLN